MAAVDDELDRTAAAAERGRDPSASVPSASVPAATDPAVTDPAVTDPAVTDETRSAISRGDGATGSPPRIVSAVVTIVTFGVVAGIAALVTGNVRPQSSLPVWPTVLAGCGVGLVYEVAARILRTRRG